MEEYKIVLKFQSKESAELFLARYIHCGGEQVVGYSIVDNKDNQEIHLEALPDIE
jgi:hypothetical protein